MRHGHSRHVSECTQRICTAVALLCHLNRSSDIRFGSIPASGDGEVACSSSWPGRSAARAGMCVCVQLLLAWRAVHHAQACVCVCAAPLSLTHIAYMCVCVCGCVCVCSRASILWALVSPAPAG